MTVSRREMRLRAQQEAARIAAEEAAAQASPPSPPEAPAQQLTRRQLRELRLQQETGEIPVSLDEPPAFEERGASGSQHTRPVPSSVTPQSPAPATDPSDRPIRRRRPVLPPQTTGSTPIIDPETGTIGAVTISFPAVPDPTPDSAPEPEEAVAPGVADATPESAPSPSEGGEEEPPAPPADDVDEAAVSASSPDSPEVAASPELAESPASAASADDSVASPSWFAPLVPPEPPVSPEEEVSLDELDESPESGHEPQESGVDHGASPSPVTALDEELPPEPPTDGDDPTELAPAITLPSPRLEQRSDLSFDEILTDGAAADGSVPKRASLFDKLADDETIFDPDEENLEAADEDDSSLTVEQAAVKTKASPAVTALRYIVLVIAMFVIGGLIWIVVERASDSASAAGISLALTSLESVLI